MGQGKKAPILIEVTNDNFTYVVIPETQKLSEFAPVFAIVCRLHGLTPNIANKNIRARAAVLAISYARQN